MTTDLQTKLGAEGWLANVEATVVLTSTTLISRQIGGSPKFSLTSEMRHMLQERLVAFFSVRDWKSADEKQLAMLRKKRIATFSETDEPLPPDGKLFKVALEDGEDDEVSVGMVFRPPQG